MKQGECKKDREFRAWVQRQPSCLSGIFKEYVNGEGRSIAAHVRRAGKSGTGYKAPFSCVPLTREEHDYQHQHGEYAALHVFWQPRSTSLIPPLYDVDAAKRWFDAESLRYFKLWCEQTFYGLVA